MTKLKKLLLTLAPISAVMIATPIILTSCSTNAEQNNGGGSTGGGSGTGGDNGSGGGSDTGGGSGGSGGGTTTNPSLTADNTNSESFKPSDKGLFNTIETAIKAGKPGEEKNKIEESITAFKSPSDLDVKDAINVWSFNKWFGANGKVQYVSNIENPIAKQDEKTKKWDINFVYKFKITTNGDKKEDVYAERTFDAKAIDLATSKGVVDFTTKASKFMVDGKDMLKDTPKLYNTKADANIETDLVKQVKAFLDATTSKFNIRTLATDYAKNKKIKGELTIKSPVWDETKIKDDKALTFDPKNPTELVMQLSATPNSEWGSCINTTSYSVVRKTFEAASGDYRYQTKLKNLVNSGDYDISAVDYGAEIKGDKTSDMDITIRFTKKSTVQGDDAKPTLTFKIKGFAKTA